MITVRSSLGTSNCRFQTGDHVTVFYDPDHVQQFYVMASKFLD